MYVNFELAQTQQLIGHPLLKALSPMRLAVKQLCLTPKRGKFSLTVETAYDFDKLLYGSPGGLLGRLGKFDADMRLLEEAFVSDSVEPEVTAADENIVGAKLARVREEHEALTPLRRAFDAPRQLCIDHSLRVSQEAIWRGFYNDELQHRLLSKLLDSREEYLLTGSGAALEGYLKAAETIVEAVRRRADYSFTEEPTLTALERVEQLTEKLTLVAILEDAL